MNTRLWNMDSGLAAARRPGMTIGSGKTRNWVTKHNELGAR
jgi:hypothetical protein